MENEKNTLPTKSFTWIEYLQSQKFRIKIHYLIYLAVPLALLLLMASLPNYRFFGQIGKWAWDILILVLFIKPVIKILGVKELMWLLSYRREMGILCAILAIAHSLANIFLFKLYSPLNYLPLNNYLFSGLIAYIILIILFLTSNNASMRYLKKNWKRLQSLSYLVLPLVTVHQILLKPESDDLLNLIFINVIFLALKILEYNNFKISSLFSQSENKY